MTRPGISSDLDALQEIASLLDPREHPHGDAVAEAIEPVLPLETPTSIDPERFRFSVKLGTAITLGLLVGLTTQRADLQTILWSIAVADCTTHAHADRTTQLEAYRRMPILLSCLDSALLSIACEVPA